MINKVILIGNVGSDVTVREVNNTKVANFSLATSEKYKDKQGQKVVNTEWHRIEIWRGGAEIAEKYVKKGITLYVEGKITTKSYEKNGVKQYVTSIIADNIRMLSRIESKPASVDNTEQITANNEIIVTGGVDDLPF